MPTIGTRTSLPRKFFTLEDIIWRLRAMWQRDFLKFAHYSLNECDIEFRFHSFLGHNSICRMLDCSESRSWSQILSSYCPHTIQSCDNCLRIGLENTGDVAEGTQRLGVFLFEFRQLFFLLFHHLKCLKSIQIKVFLIVFVVV